MLWVIANVSPKIHRPQQRLDAQEPHRRRRLQQLRDALVGRALVLDAGSQPDVGQRAGVPVVLLIRGPRHVHSGLARPRLHRRHGVPLLEEPLHAMGPLREDLEGVPRCSGHHAKRRQRELVPDPEREQVGADPGHCRLSPAPRIPAGPDVRRPHPIERKVRHRVTAPPQTSAKTIPNTSTASTARPSIRATGSGPSSSLQGRSLKSHLLRRAPLAAAGTTPAAAAHTLPA